MYIRIPNGEDAFLLLFVGSLLVSAAHFGGYVMGTDIDYLLLHAKGKKHIWSDKILFLFLHKNICCGCSLEVPHEKHMLWVRYF